MLISGESFVIQNKKQDIINVIHVINFDIIFNFYNNEIKENNPVKANNNPLRI